MSQHTQPHATLHVGDTPHGGHKIQIAGASWCGYTNKFVDAVKKHPMADKFEYVDCSKHKDHDACVGVSGFPTLKKNGSVCHVGYAPVDEAVKKCSAE